MSNYRRSRINGGTWFFTVNLQNRHSDLLVRHVQILRRAVKSVLLTRPFTIDAWVTLPEHMHCIWTLPEDDCDYSARWREIKKSFTCGLHAAGIWQPRFWEHMIRDEVDYRRHKEYCYINPLKHGWVKQVQDWPWSSFHRDVRLGLYPQNWGGEVTEMQTGERR